MPRVSVLMPVFNTVRFLPSALRSIQEQQFTDFELVVVDDGSTDGCNEVLRRFAQCEPRTRLIQSVNEGLTATRNKLLAHATGEFIAWMDSDDLCRRERLYSQIAAFEAAQDLVCVGTAVELIDPTGRPLGVELYPENDREIRAEQLRGGGMRFASTMLRRTVALRVGGFRSPFRMGEDFDYLMRIAEQGRVHNLPERLYVYRQHLHNTCTTHGATWPKYRQLILELAAERRQWGTDRLQRGETVSVPETDSKDTSRFQSLVLLEWARAARELGDVMRAIHYTLCAIRSAPVEAAGWRYLVKLLLFRS